jgi:hypothetical protein
MIFLIDGWQDWGDSEIVGILFFLNLNLLNFTNSQNFRDSKKFNNSFNSGSNRKILTILKS